MSSDTWIFISIFSFLSGVFTHSLFPLVSLPFFLCFTVTLIVLWNAVLFRSTYLKVIAVALIFLLLGVYRFDLSSLQNNLPSYDEALSLQGYVISDPDTSAHQTRFMFHTVAYDRGGVRVPLDLRLLVRTSNFISYHYGDYLEVYGRLEKPEVFITDTGRSFDYASYLAKDHIYYTLSYAQVRVLKRQTGFSIRSSLFNLKHHILDRIYRYIPRPESDLLAGILLGEQSRLGKEREDDFRRVGLMHIVVLSGYNVSLVIYTFLFLLGFLKPWLKMFFVVLAIIAFAIITGAGPTILRASIMAFFLVLARTTHQPYNVSRALVLAGTIMVFVNPRILLFDLSFQLSFLASYGLIRFAPFFEKKFSCLPQTFLIRESAVASFSAQVMVLPLILYQMGEFSLIAPVVNIFVLFAVPPAMLLGFLVAFDWILPAFIIKSIAFFATLLLKYQLVLVELFAKLPFATFTLEPFHWGFLLAAYLLILLPAYGMMQS